MQAGLLNEMIAFTVASQSAIIWAVRLKVG